MPQETRKPQAIWIFQDKQIPQEAANCKKIGKSQSVSKVRHMIYLLLLKLQRQMYMVRKCHNHGSQTNSWQKKHKGEQISTMAYTYITIIGLITHPLSSGDMVVKLCGVWDSRISAILKVSNGAKIRNRYNQVPHLTQDTNWKVTNSQKTPQTRAKRSALSQQVTTKHI